MISMLEPGRRAVTVTVAAAIVGALLVWALAVPLAGVDLIVGSGATRRPVGAGAVAVVALIAALAATGLAALLARTVPHPRRTWLIVATAVLLLSLTGPLGAATAGAGIVLVALHLVVGATLMLGIGGTLPPGPARVPDRIPEKGQDR